MSCEPVRVDFGEDHFGVAVPTSRGGRSLTVIGETYEGM